eukprot:242635_1
MAMQAPGVTVDFMRTRNSTTSLYPSLKKVPCVEDSTAPAVTAQKLKLKVVPGFDDIPQTYRVPTSGPLSKLMQHHCERVGTNTRSVEFKWRGKRLLGAETPDQLGMKDGQMIFVENLETPLSIEEDDRNFPKEPDAEET